MKCGYVAVVGRPNSGKSTMINALAGKKVSIVSEKPQTTRFKLRAIVTTPDAQVIFVDTPGFHQARDALGDFLNSQVKGTLREVDLILFLVDASRELREEDRKLAAEVKKSGRPAMLVLTKKDLCSEAQLQAASELAGALLEFKEKVSIAAITGEGLDILLDKIISFLPEGPFLYPEDMVTDYPLTIQAAEIVREKVLGQTYQEVPHAVAVEVQRIEERADRNLLEIEADIYVEKDSQKKIVIGKEGAMIKKIGTLAREELEFLTGKKVFLSLRVKVKEKWKEKESFIRRIYRS